MLTAQFIFVAAWTVVKYVGNRLPLFEIIFFRGLFSLVILIPLTHFRLHTFRGSDISTLFLRALFGFIALALSFYAMIHMEIGNTVTLFNTLPIFVALFAPSLLGEPFGKLQFALTIVSFAGITMILKPDEGMLSNISIYALSAGFFAALAMICIRKLRMTDSTLIITLYFTVFITIASSPMAIASFIMPTPGEWGCLVAVGTSITFGQLFMTKAYRFGRASTIAPFSYFSVILSYISGLIFFTEIPDWLSLMGAFIIVASGIGIMLTAPEKRCVPGSTPCTRT